MNKYTYLFLSTLILAIAGPILVFGDGAFIVSQGGTGWQALQANTILLGNGKGRLATTTAGVNGQYLVLLNGVPRWATATTSFTGTVTSIATTFPIQGGTITTTGTLTFGGFGTTSPWTQGGVVTAGPNQNSGYTTATNTISGSGVITVTAGASVLSSVPITVACSTCGTGSVTSITGGTGLSGGTITTAGTLSLKSYFSTTTADTSGQLPYWSSTNGTPATFASVATSSQSDSVAFSDSGTLGAAVGGSTNIRSSVTQPGFFVATSTAWAGTTTIAIPVNLAYTINGIRCFTNVGTLNIQTGIGTASTTMLNASTTANFNTFTTSNTTAAGNKLFIDIGTPASSPTQISCSYKLTT